MLYLNPSSTPGKTEQSLKLLQIVQGDRRVDIQLHRVRYRGARRVRRPHQDPVRKRQRATRQGETDADGKETTSNRRRGRQL